MADNNTNNAGKTSFTSNILGGQFLSQMNLKRHGVFILYIFILIIAYITINFNVEATLVKQRNNQLELKNLKSNYTSKVARLQDQSKQGTVEQRLIATESKVEKPKTPARLVEIPR